MSKGSYSKALYTLNDSQKFQHSDSELSDVEEPNNFITTVEEESAKQELDRVISQNEQLEKKMYELKLKNKDLSDNLELSELRNQKHEEKQRQLIKKLSHQQVATKQLQFEVKKFSEELFKIKENYKAHDHRNIQINTSFTKQQEQKAFFIQSFKRIAEAISTCTDHHQFSHVMNKFTEFLRKNMKQYEMAPINSDFSFDTKFQLEKITSYRAKNMELEEKCYKIQEELEREKSQKRKVMIEYTQKINKLKTQCDSLKHRVDQKERQNQLQIGHLKKILNEKNEQVYELNMKIEQHKFKKDCFGSKKSRMKKRSFYIGDGQRQLAEVKMSQLQDQIEQLERKLVKELQQ